MKPECQSPKCARPQKARGYCINCYVRRRRLGLPMNPSMRRKAPVRCEASGCGDFGKAFGLCPKHYQRVIQRGTVAEWITGKPVRLVCDRPRPKHSALIEQQRGTNTDGMTARIPLRSGHTVLVDAADLPKVSNYTWTNTGRYAMARTLGPMHRFLIGAPEGVEVDHVNGNKLDNRRANLRVAGHAQNRWNCPKHKFKKPPSSRFKGVSREKNEGYFRATIRVHGQHFGLGYHEDERDAALAYDRAALEHFGEFACTNLIGPNARAA